MNNTNGQNLVFLVSQPRSGSTLTQRILSNHSDIFTQSEPWILLHPLSVFRPEMYESAFDSTYYTMALHEFIEELPGGKAAYIEEIATTYQRFYQHILDSKNKTRFLDKTPRYYLIIDELISFFPNAKIILLVRNPLAVLCSIIKNWAGINFENLYKFRHDLLVAPKIMAKYRSTNTNKNIQFLIFEDLILDPITSIKNICEFLNLSFNEKILDISIPMPDWTFGDSINKNQKNTIQNYYYDSWKEDLKDPQVRRFASEYLKMLGSDIVEQLGYSFNELINITEETDNISNKNELWSFSDKLLVKFNSEKNPLGNIQTTFALLKKEINKLQTQNSMQEEKIQLHKNEKNTLLKNINKKDIQIKQLQVELQIRENQLQDIRQSYSFKAGQILTFPVRKMMDTFPKKKPAQGLKEKPIYLVYTSGKVGSLTLSSSLQKALPNTSVFHVHYLSDAYFKKNKKNSKIKISDKKVTKTQIERCIRLHPEHKVKIITLVREPIIRAISSLFQNWEFHFGKGTTLTCDELIENINLSQIIYGTQWLDKEFKMYTNVDIYSLPFNTEVGYAIYNLENFDLLVIRLEDLERVFEEALLKFTGTNIEKVNNNITANKAGANLYMELKSKFKLSPEDFEKISETKYMHHFYSASEIKEFRERWVRE